MNTEENKTTETPLTTEKPQTAEEKEMFNLDVCFLLDTTGSMQPSIDMARDKIKEIITELKAQYADSEVRIAVVSYKDNGDKDQHQVFKFNTSVDEAHSFLASLHASGGGDYPEDVNGGFRNVVALEWKTYTTKMLYHLADAPCHGKQFHDSGDSHPDGLKGDEPWTDLLKKVYDLDINYLYFDIGGVTEKMYKEFKKMYESFGEKSHLIFSYEKMSIPQKSSSLFATTTSLSYPSVSTTSLSSSSMSYPTSMSFGSSPPMALFSSSDSKESKNSNSSMKSECEEKFVKATVGNAKAQQMKNFAYQQAKFSSNF